MSAKRMKHAAMVCSEKYVASMHRKQTVQMYKEWRAGIPPEFFKRFLQEGVKPFLAKHGYILNPSLDILSKYCAEWAFAHVKIQRRKHEFLQCTLLKSFHDGGDEEFDWFQFTIPIDAWEDLAEEWKCPEFLDDSDAGLAQRSELSMFIWKLVDLNCSKKHIEWMRINEDNEENDIQYLQPQQTQEEQAFGGDRRTH
jgi:hypothetical protein